MAKIYESYCEIKPGLGYRFLDNSVLKLLKKLTDQTWTVMFIAWLILHSIVSVVVDYTVQSAILWRRISATSMAFHVPRTAGSCTFWPRWPFRPLSINYQYEKMKFINHGSKPTNHTPEALVAREILFFRMAMSYQKPKEILLELNSEITWQGGFYLMLVPT